MILEVSTLLLNDNMKDYNPSTQENAYSAL